MAITTLAAVANGATLLLAADNLGSTPGNGNVTVTVGTLNSLSGGGGLGGTSIMNIRADIVGDTSSTGSGAAFVTAQGSGAFGLGANGLRLLTGGELNSSLVNSANVSLGAATTLGGSAINSLTLASSGSLNAPGTPSILTIGTATGAGILATSNSSINGGQIQGQTAGSPFYIHTAGSGTTLTFGGYLDNQTAGITKALDGTLNFTVAQEYAGTTVVNAGMLKLSSGAANTLWVLPTITVPTIKTDLTVNGGTVDLNGQNQAVGNLLSNGAAPLPGQGGIITNSAGGAVVTFTASGPTATPIFAGQITGNLNFNKGNTQVLTLINNNTYTGATTIMGGSLVLKDSGALSSTSAININGGTLQLDDSGLYYNGANNTTARTNAAAIISLNGGTLTYQGATFGTSTTLASTSNVTLGGLVNAASGANTITATSGSSTGAF